MAQPPFPLQEFFPLQPLSPDLHPPSPLQPFFPLQEFLPLSSIVVTFAPALAVVPAAAAKAGEAPRIPAMAAVAISVFVVVFIIFFILVCGVRTIWSSLCMIRIKSIYSPDAENKFLPSNFPVSASSEIRPGPKTQMMIAAKRKRNGAAAKNGSGLPEISAFKASCSEVA